MKTSFHDIIETEKYLQQELEPEDKLVFEARLLVSDQWRRNTFLHKLVHRLVHLYHRKKLKAELEAVHNKLFRDPAKASYRNQITSLFNR